jgi:crotonyl-CoA reductase
MWAYGITKDKIKTITRIPVNKRIPSNGIEKLNVPIPKIDDLEVLIKVKSSSLNYNSLWSAMCYPMTPIQLISSHIQRNPAYKGHLENHFIFGSDASGIIKKIGKNVQGWREGDEVVIHCNVVNEFDSNVQNDGMLSESHSIWGYETNYGAFAEYTKVRASQLIKKPKNINWQVAASYNLCLSTAYRMLISKNGAKIRAGDTCFIWGASGGLGSFAIQLAKLSGAKVIAVVSSEEKKEICYRLGADFVFNRKTEFPENFITENGDPNYVSWRKIKSLLTKKRIDSIDVVFEHIGRETLGLSTYLVKRGGKVVICAATSGYLSTIDLRFLWMQLKTIIGSHFANYNEATLASELIFNNKINPLIHSINKIDKLPEMMDNMYNGRTFGKIVFNHEK